MFDKKFFFLQVFACFFFLHFFAPTSAPTWLAKTWPGKPMPRCALPQLLTSLCGLSDPNNRHACGSTVWTWATFEVDYYLHHDLSDMTSAPVKRPINCDCPESWQLFRESLGALNDQISAKALRSSSSRLPFLWKVFLPRALSVLFGISLPIFCLYCPQWEIGHETFHKRTKYPDISFQSKAWESASRSCTLSTWRSDEKTEQYHQRTFHSVPKTCVEREKRQKTPTTHLFAGKNRKQTWGWHEAVFPKTACEAAMRLPCWCILQENKITPEKKRRNYS